MAVYCGWAGGRRRAQSFLYATGAGGVCPERDENTVVSFSKMPLEHNPNIKSYPVHEESKDSGCCKNPKKFMVDPHGDVRRYWDLMSLVLLLYSG